jgi:hypothetical protein
MELWVFRAVCREYFQMKNGAITRQRKTRVPMTPRRNQNRANQLQVPPGKKRVSSICT